MIVTKLDGRHTGVANWKYYTEINYRSMKLEERKKLFHDWREWCWNNWGPSKELTDYDHYDLYDNVCSSNAHWCWLNDEHGRRRIYLRSDQDLEAFTLRWI
jgi:hypothetical protein